MDFWRQAFLNEYYRHEKKIESLCVQYLKKYQAVPLGTTFEYEGETCTVVGAKLDDISLDDCFSELNPDYDIIYFIDIPQWRVESQPDMKVRWNQKRLVKFLNGELKDYQISPNL
jgi:hypothetical protein